MRDGIDLSIEAVRERFVRHAAKQLPRGRATRLAAVAMVLTEANGQPEILLIRRRADPRDPWSGHIAFPGGRQDPGDGDSWATAQRETLEEVGIDLSTSERLGSVDEIQAISKGKARDLVIAPHIFHLRERVAPTPDASEVDEALWMPLGPLTTGELDTERPYEMNGQKLILPGYRIGEHILWGLTFRMLQLFFDVMTR